MRTQNISQQIKIIMLLKRYFKENFIKDENSSLNILQQIYEVESYGKIIPIRLYKIEIKAF